MFPTTFDEACITCVWCDNHALVRVYARSLHGSASVEVVPHCTRRPLLQALRTYPTTDLLYAFLNVMLKFIDSSVQSLTVIAILAATFLYTLYGAVWRLYLSPIAKFPGPWFAALTFWNEFYYDVWLGGKYTWKIAEYHEKYGTNMR